VKEKNRKKGERKTGKEKSEKTVSNETAFPVGNRFFAVKFCFFFWILYQAVNF